MRALLWLELLTLFLGAPLLLWSEVLPGPKLQVLLVALGYVLIVHRLAGLPAEPTQRADRATLRRLLALIGLRFAIAAPLLALVTWTWFPELWLAFPRQRPGIWLLVMCLYPWISALPQEYIYRTFLLRRYQILLPRPALVAGSVLLFGYLHIFYDNPIALGLSTLGGVVFTHSYLRSGRLWVAALEHAVYGCWLFTVGLGRFFYEGPVPPPP